MLPPRRRSGGTSALILHGRTGLSLEPRWASSKKSFTFTDDDEAQVGAAGRRPPCLPLRASALHQQPFIATLSGERAARMVSRQRAALLHDAAEPDGLPRNLPPDVRGQWSVVGGAGANLWSRVRLFRLIQRAACVCAAPHLFSSVTRTSACCAWLFCDSAVGDGLFVHLRPQTRTAVSLVRLWLTHWFCFLPCGLFCWRRDIYVWDGSRRPEQWCVARWTSLAMSRALYAAVLLGLAVQPLPLALTSHHQPIAP